MRIYLHLGFHKTGTTHVQQVCAENRRLLLDVGLLFPKTGYRASRWENGATSGHRVLRTAFQSIATHAPSAFIRSSLIREILASGAETVLISSEDFLNPHSPIEPSRVREVLGSLGEIYPVAYVRRQDRFGDSMYREMMTWAYRKIWATPDQFARRPLAQSYLDIRSRIAPWLEEFGREKCVIRSYDDVMAEGDLLDDLFEQLVVRRPEGLVIPQSTTYRSVGREVANVLRALNSFDGVTPEVKKKVANELRCDQFWSDRQEPRSTTLFEDRTWEYLASRYRDDNEWLAAHALSGPTNRFQFPTEREPTVLAEQRYTFEEAEILVQDRWPEIFAEEAVEPVESLATRGFLSAVREQARSGESSGTGSRLKIGLTALIHGPYEQVDNWVNYHLNLGVDHIVLFLDGPPFHHELKGRDRLTVIECDEEFWRNNFVTSMSTVAQKLRPARELGHKALAARGMDWIAAIDGDELLYGDIREAVSEVGDDIDQLVCPSAEAVWHSGTAPIPGFAQRVFKLLPATPDARAACKNEYQSVSAFTQDGFFGHVEGKTVVRAEVDAEIWGSHTVQHTQKWLPKETARSVLLLHFESSDYERWCRRWNERIAVHPPERHPRDNHFPDHRTRQYQFLSGLFQEGDSDKIRAAYREWYFRDDDAIDRLEASGLITRLNIPDIMFSRPDAPGIGNELGSFAKRQQVGTG